MNEESPPLAGIQVLDLTQIYSGPYATFLMAMAGAEVIKVEPPAGEPLRWRDAQPGAGVPFAMLNANKQCLSLNLKSPRGLELFNRLAREVDVVIENFAPGVTDRLKISYEHLRADNPDLIYASGSGYGQTGRYARYPAMDLTVQAMAGVMSVTGFPDQPPVKAGVALCDFFAGVHLYGAVATALLHRERTGKGTCIDVAMLDAVYPSLASNIGGRYADGANRTDGPDARARTGNRHGGLALCPYNVYPTCDGYIAIIGNREEHWHRLLAAMQRDDLRDDIRYTGVQARVERMQEVDDLIATWTCARGREDLFETLSLHRVPAAPVRELDEVMSDPALHDRGMLLEVDHPEHGPIVVCRSPVNYAGLPQVEYRISQGCGAANRELLSNRLGLTEQEVAALARDGVI